MKVLLTASWRYVLSVVFLLLLTCSCQQRDVTVESISPDRKKILRLVELPGFDRNFEISLITNNIDHVIFRSPDEGRPIGTEFFVWSEDSRYALLCGSNFYVVPSADCKNLKLYLLLDVEKLELRCNAAQINERRFTYSDAIIAGIKDKRLKEDCESR